MVTTSILALASRQNCLSPCRPLKIPYLTKFTSGVSLHDEVIAEFLRRVDRQVYLPDPGCDYLFDEADLHLVTVAARRFVDGTTYRATQRPADLFDMVNEFSSMTYERAGAGGQLVISDLHTLQEHLQIRFQKPVPLRESRSMRKLLELSDKDTSVLPTTIAPMVWDLRLLPPLQSKFQSRVMLGGVVPCKDDNLPRVTNGQAHYRSRQLPAKFPRNCPTYRRKCRIDRIWEVIQAAQESRHGSTIVISADPQGETKRLSGQALPITPDYLDPRLLVRLGDVDGAILIGTDSRCHAFGVILDGIAGAQGDRARGSRFNSAVRYQQTTEAPSVIVVISGRRFG